MLKVVYEDNCILVADKPGGMAVHPSKLHQGDTLADEVRRYLGIDEDDFVFRCITRLDKDTSGLVLIAKTLEAAQKLSEAMAARKIHREYEAVVEDGRGFCGKPETECKIGAVNESINDNGYDNKGLLPDEGTVNAPIARASEDEHDIRRCVDFEKGESAVTHYRVIERGEGYAKVRCILETGRTHQIRVHMQYLGHPIKGDKLYNPSETKVVEDAKGAAVMHGKSSGMGLRAVQLTFPHPLTGKVMQVV